MPRYPDYLAVDVAMIPDLRSDDRRVQFKAAQTLLGGVFKIWPGEPGQTPVFGSIEDEAGLESAEPMSPEELEDFLESMAEDEEVGGFRGPLTTLVVLRAVLALVKIIKAAIG